MYKVVVFDIDGTLIDSSIMISYLYEAYDKMFNHKDYDDFKICFYMSTDEIKEYLKISDDKWQEFEDLAFGKHAIKMTNVKLFDNVETLLKSLYEKGIKIAINTSRNAIDMPELDKAFRNIYEYLDKDLIITSDKVRHHKPAPDGLELIKDKTAVDKKDILFVGDSIKDGECAINFGCDFALANWAMVDNNIKANYYPNDPLDILKIVGNLK